MPIEAGEWDASQASPRKKRDLPKAVGKGPVVETKKRGKRRGGGAA
jgi:hypothetical protein